MKCDLRFLPLEKCKLEIGAISVGIGGTIVHLADFEFVVVQDSAKRSFGSLGIAIVLHG